MLKSFITTFLTVGLFLTAVHGQTGSNNSNKSDPSEKTNNGNGASKTATQPPVVTPASADSDWAELEVLFKGNGQGLALGGDKGNGNAKGDSGAMLSAGEKLKSNADKAKAFRDRFSDSHPQAAQVRGWEAKARLQAVLVGEGAELENAESIASQAIDDLRLEEIDRYDIASLAEMVKMRALPDNRREQQNEKSASARRLIAKFPK
jgi:hypothetical protein